MSDTNKTFQISVKLSEGEKEALVSYCEENDVKMAWVMRKALNEFLNKTN